MKHFNKLLSLMLPLTLCMSYSSVIAFATEEAHQETPITLEEIESVQEIIIDDYEPIVSIAGDDIIIY